MGSVMTYDDECPRCKRESLHSDFYYKTGETYDLCPECGYFYSNKLKRDEYGNYVLKSPELVATLSNFESEETVYENPYCSYTIEQKKGYTQIGSIVDEAAFEELKLWIETEKEKGGGLIPDVTKVSISRFMDGEIKKEVLYTP